MISCGEPCNILTSEEAIGRLSVKTFMAGQEVFVPVYVESVDTDIPFKMRPPFLECFYAGTYIISATYEGVKVQRQINIIPLQTQYVIIDFLKPMEVPESNYLGGVILAGIALAGVGLYASGK